ncbi:MAG: phosphatidylinositol-4- kinase [Bathelium mastoideum]|nr:MAG: phosphatidylinositol-4- kinase [Bathelium mastoideum]
MSPTAPHKLRRNAFEKLAILSAQPSTAQLRSPDIEKLCQLYPRKHSQTNGSADIAGRHEISEAKTPMSLRELETAVALSKAVICASNTQDIELLLPRLKHYLLLAPRQTFSESPFLRDFKPSPWEAFTFNVTSGLLAAGRKAEYLRDEVMSVILIYVETCGRLAKTSPNLGANGGLEEMQDEYGQSIPPGLAQVIHLAISLLGFLEAAAKDATFFSPRERVHLIMMIREILSDSFMTALETALSTIRNAKSLGYKVKEWKRWVKHYAVDCRPLGAMLLRQAFMSFVYSCACLLVAPHDAFDNEDVLDTLQSKILLQELQKISSDTDIVESIADIATEEYAAIEAGADYLQLGSAWQHRLAFHVKAYALKSFLCCSLLQGDAADPDLLLTWLESTLADPVQMADRDLATSVLKCLAVLGRTSPTLASSLSRSLPRYIVQGSFDTNLAPVAADTLSSILEVLPDDTTITTLYSLGNVLSSASGTDRIGNLSSLNGGAGKASQGVDGTRYLPTDTSISLELAESDDYSVVYGTVIQTIVGVASKNRDEKMTALAQSMLVQKIGRVNAAVDAKIIVEVATLGIYGGLVEFRALLKLYSKLSHDALAQGNQLLLHSIHMALLRISQNIAPESEKYEVYLCHLLDSIVSKGDAHGSDSIRDPEIELVSKEIEDLLEPLALLYSVHKVEAERAHQQDHISGLQRDAWFNMVVHNFSMTSKVGLRHRKELELIAKYTRPTIPESAHDQVESDVELNPVLRRAMTPQRTTEEKSELIRLLPGCESDIRSLTYPEVVFLRATYLISYLRAAAGDFDKNLYSFLDPKLKSSAMSKCMLAIASKTVDIYIGTTLQGELHAFSAPYVAQQLSAFFIGCCHRIERVQQAAFLSADRIISKIPAALCQKRSLFTLLELLSIMFYSCLEADVEEYDWKSRHTSSKECVSVELSDNYTFRHITLTRFHRKAKSWILEVTNVAPLDIKGLLQTYLSEYDDDGAYGHIALGRSFALEMGSVIPSTDQRLGAIEPEREFSVDTASDFIAQYTTRQEYRLDDSAMDCRAELLPLRNGIAYSTQPTQHGRRVRDVTSTLAEIEKRILRRESVPTGEVRDGLRSAAAILCRPTEEQYTLVQHMVKIPFALFTKHSIKLGISLWMGVIKENPRMETRILVEIASNWEDTVRKRMGMFHDKFKYVDPFYVKEEFAPSDRGAIARRQQATQNLIAPHYRLLQFLSSHFNATRLCSPQVEKAYHRLMHITLAAMQRTVGSPLGRENHFYVVLLGLQILQFSTNTQAALHWRLKDSILSSGLAWFSLPPRWSFGGNKLQIKAEVRLLSDVMSALNAVSGMRFKPTSQTKSLQSKQDLLLILINSEQSRLTVWLSPLDQERKHHLLPNNHARTPADATLMSLLGTAWLESPALATQLATRFASQRLHDEIRTLIVRYPERVIDVADALYLMIGASLPKDLSWQLKYLLYWAPVNPITAVTYFLPAHGNHPFIIQYAMRALDSHSVDVTFFFVPQIVQTLRYDVLGYVERYIIETAKFSQLFAHQIIWNMKANSYKDEDATIPDGIKPALDTVMDALIESFSPSDRDFYEREFSFFNEVTGISGKLKPFIKEPKPVKKQKIEEELRKIKVDVGVYLPSNPDGVVVGIDRKSGKPLQSHAKAPYMATFRIRKDKTDLDDLESEDQVGFPNVPATKPDRTYEVWQSAIFKVGDDCRQDVLALQMISCFRGIFADIGLDVYVHPYRVTATAPGCGVIDFLPNSISRDMLGREAVNGLYEYFVSKYGGEDSIRFQTARTNFVKSMAAYSVISYLLQFKDRHNGNIMLDDAGHILHIDFGFCFDIAPGGVKFERAPFKLTSEMVAVMSGPDRSTTSQSYQWFEELCIKSFLASRQHAEKLIQVVVVMLDSGLPCFKPETIDRFRERFVLEKTEREAAEFMKELCRKSYGDYSTRVYDQFQYMTNGIPYQ